MLPLYAKTNRPPFGGQIQISFRPTIGTDGRVLMGAQPWPSESSFLHIFMHTRDEGFASEEEMNDFLKKYMPPGKKPKFPRPAQPWHQAQEIAYRGWDKKTIRGREASAHKALKISQYAVDPYLLLAHDAPDWGQAYEFEIQALSMAIKLLEVKLASEYEYDYWQVAITRPYMRARFALGYTLWKQGNHDQSKDHFQDLLRLNPGDNQGARYIVEAILLEKGTNYEALRLMGKFSDDNLNHWRYNRALLQYRRKADSPASRDLLRQALKQNPNVATYLSGGREIYSWAIDYLD